MTGALNPQLGFSFRLMLGPGEKIFIPVSQHGGGLKPSELIGKMPAQCRPGAAEALKKRNVGQLR